MPDPNNTVLPDHGVVLMCIAKSGNTSLVHAVTRALGLQRRADKVFTNATLAECATRYSDCLRVTIVRNPWDRMVSCWADKVGRNWIPSLARFGLYPGMPFPAFVEAVCETTDEEARGSAQHFRGQVFDLVHDGKLVPDVVGRFEAFTDSWTAIRSAIRDRGLDIGSPLHLNSTCKGDYRAQYDNRLRKMVAERFAGDIETFGYRF